MIRTIREELLDQILFWNQLDLERKLAAFRIYYNRHRVHSGIDGIPPEQTQGRGQHTTLPLTEFRWMFHCHGLYQLPVAAVLDFAYYTLDIEVTEAVRKMQFKH